ncbi:MAG: ABC transporter permease [Spirochaetia bacterium]|jgi:ABC-type dipeptide/oligopeptide/nickel transport system permease subunit|uniref:Oligopeptide transport system permease protein AppC n=2 Tax=root TaxID=1 RepID=A0A652ZTU6_9SPIR|nr:ABC transporter permease [Spirochaetia bacterium]MCE1208342.1 ABC transporter permease [Spirochaetia bacterium]VBB39186.1 Oligopeptide transport system permease protein AppC [uncultured Spirochaetota bacterium]
MIAARKSQKILFSLAVLFLLILVAAAIAAPLVAPYNPTEQFLTKRFKSPTLENLLGTDNYGRDVLSRIIYGSRSALIVGIVTVSIALSLGGTIGLLAGLGSRNLDSVLMLFMDSILSFPTILLAITVVSFLGYGLVQVMLALGIISSPVFARLVRAETLAIKGEGYVEAARALGTPVIKIVFKHIIPNILGKVVVQCSIVFALSIVTEASLSYLGVGTQPPQASWGLMLKDARNYLVQAPWLAIYPGLVLAFTVLSFNIIGDTLSERLNPRLTGSS